MKVIYNNEIKRFSDNIDFSTLNEKIPSAFPMIA